MLSIRLLHNFNCKLRACYAYLWKLSSDYRQNILHHLKPSLIQTRPEMALALIILITIKNNVFWRRFILRRANVLFFKWNVQ